MLRLPESPRARRRLFWSAGAGTLLVLGLVVALAIPNKKAGSGLPTIDEGPAQLAVDTHVKISRADRAAISRLLGQFIPAAVTRSNMALAYRLAGPEMKAAQPKAAFLKGDAPVPNYPANEKSYDHWQAIDVEKRAVILDILVHPTHPKTTATWVFSVQVVKPKTQWLVNRIYTIAVMNPVERPRTVTHELGPADYAAPPAGGTSRGKAPKPVSLGDKGLILPLAIVGLVLSIPLALGLIALWRRRRWKKITAAYPQKTLPPLPTGYRKEREDEHELASHS